MPSEKVTRALLSRGVSADQIQPLTEQQAWELVREKPRARIATVQRVRVCFTGFGPEEREALESIAVRAGHHVARAVNKSLGILVCGDNPGPSKLEQARAQRVEILTADEYRQFVDDERHSETP